MGQYYNILTQNNNGELKLYNRLVNNEYTMAKLTEHSWIGNSCMDSFCNTIIGKPTKVAWIGDYADNLELIPNEINKETLKNLHEMAWHSLKEYTLNKQKINYAKYFLVNHTKNIYLDFDKYINYNSYNDKYFEGWCLHPLSLLTALGNGLGGGDYHGINESEIGSWAWDCISLEEKEKFNNTEFLEVSYEFKENI